MTDTTMAPAADAVHDPLGEGFPPGLMGRALFWLAVVFSLFQFATAAHLIDMPSQRNAG